MTIYSQRYYNPLWMNCQYKRLRILLYISDKNQDVFLIASKKKTSVKNQRFIKQIRRLKRAYTFEICNFFKLNYFVEKMISNAASSPLRQLSVSISISISISICLSLYSKTLKNSLEWKAGEKAENNSIFNFEAPVKNF